MIIRINRRVFAVALASVLALFAIWGLVSAAPAQADPCGLGEVKVIIVGTGLGACVPASALPTVTVTLPRVTTTVTLPRVTITKVRTLPKATVSLPGSVRTIVKTQRVPGPVSTKTVVSSRVNPGLVETLPRQTVTQRATITASPVTTTVTAPTRVRTNEVVVTKVQAATVSIILIILGALLALALLRAAYTYGWIRGDDGNRVFIKEVTDDLRYKD